MYIWSSLSLSLSMTTVVKRVASPMASIARILFRTLSIWELCRYIFLSDVIYEDVRGLERTRNGSWKSCQSPSFINL